MLGVGCFPPAGHSRSEGFARPGLANRGRSYFLFSRVIIPRRCRDVSSCRGTWDIQIVGGSHGIKLSQASLLRAGAFINRGNGSLSHSLHFLSLRKYRISLPLPCFDGPLLSNALTRHHACPRGRASSEVSHLHQDTGTAASRNDQTSLPALSAARYRGLGTQRCI